MIEKSMNQAQFDLFIKLADHANQTSLASKTWGYVY